MTVAIRVISTEHHLARHVARLDTGTLQALAIQAVAAHTGVDLDDEMVKVRVRILPSGPGQVEAEVEITAPILPPVSPPPAGL